MNSFLRLCRSELHRLVARRITLVLGLVFAAIILALTVIGYAQHSNDLIAGDPWLVSDTMDAVKGMLGVGALLGFVLGASAGGAEWSARTMQALLFWEPRRVRVVAAKVIALAIVSVSLAVLGQILVVAGTWLVATTHGSTAGYTGDAWSEIFRSQGRGFLLVVLAATTAFALSSLTRNTGAALGAAFVYLVILEQILFNWKQGLVPWLLTPNVAALIAGHVTLDNATSSVTVTAGHAFVVLTLYVAGLLAATTALFARRDVT